jgi:Uri superfamily endonuclease
MVQHIIRSLAQRLKNHLDTLAPIEGVTVRNRDDKSTWEIDYLPEATVQQKRAVENFLRDVDVEAIMVVTDDERVEKEFSKSDLTVVIFEALFSLGNDVRELKGQSPLTRPQLKSWLKSKLPPAAEPLS